MYDSISIFLDGFAFLLCGLATVVDGVLYYVDGGKRRFLGLLFNGAATAYFGKSLFVTFA